MPSGGDVTCSITNTAVQPTLTLIKSVINTGGGTAVPSDWTLTAAGPATVTGAGNSAAVTEQEVPVGTYALSESGGPAGFNPSAWSCTGDTASTGTSVTIAPGDAVVCTIVNSAAPASLTLIKEVDNGDTGADTAAAAWTLTATGPITISGTTGTSGRALPGTYTLTESGPAGYDASDWSCTGAAATTASSVTIALGNNAVCMLTNTARQPQLTLVKTVVNDNGGTAEATDWTLSADGPTPISGTVGNPTVTNAAVEIGSYDLAESGGPAGYTAGNWTCTGATLTGSTVAIALGDDATCTITNNDQPAQLTLVKNVDNPDGSGGAAAPADWTLTADGPTTITGTSGSDPVTDATVDGGDYTLTEADGPAGYTAANWTCTGATVNGAAVTVPNGGDVTCTITNTAQQAHLTLVKTVTNDNGGTAVPTDWTLTADGPTTGITGPVGDPAVTDTPVAAGDYQLTEAGGPAGYTASAWSCTGATVTGATVAIALGDDATCTIHNNDQPAQLTLVKTVDHGTTGDTTPATAWTLTGTGPTPISGTTGSNDVTGATVNAGTYDLTETGPAGFTATAWDCGPATITGTTVTVPNGADITCTITNTARQAHLTLVKTVVNDNGGTAVPTDWTLSATGPTTGITGAVGAAAVTDVPVEIGSYDLAESGGPTGYTAGDWSCTGGSLTDSTVSVGLGDEVTCTITNNDVLGTWDLAKSSDPASGATVLPGDEITYTVTATKTGGVNPVDRVVTDDLSKVLDNATLVDGPTASTGTASVSGTTMTWQIPSLTGTQTVTYTVRVDADAYGVTIGNVATGEGSDTCPPTSTRCSTTHHTPHYTLAKSSDPASGDTVLPGDAISYTLTMHNDSDGVVSGAVVTDDLSDVLDNATLGTVEAGGSVSGTTLTWAAPTLQPGGTATLTYTVTVNAGAYDQTLRNVATPGPGGDCATTCSTTHPTPHYTLTKTSDPATGETVQPGDTIGYTLTAHNDSDGVVSGAVVTDDLSDVLDNSTLGTVGSGGSVTGTTLSWTVPTLQPGDTATVTYSVTVNDGAWGVNLHNVATPGPGGDCTEACSTTHPTPRWLLAKSSDPASGSTVQPGAKITYTLTAQNVSDAVVRNGIATDDLSDVLNHATLDSVPAGATVTGTTLHWALPELQPDQTATLSYTVTVNTDALGQRLHNVATPGPGGNCVPVGDIGDLSAGNARAAALSMGRAAAFSVGRAAAEDPEVCQTTHLTPDWTLTKTSNPASGSTVQPGGVVTYTLTAHNPSAAVVTGATATDDLSGVLDHATLRQPLPSGAALSGTTLSWTLPTLQPGGTVRLSYAVTVDSDAYDATLTNVVTPGGYGHCAGCVYDHPPHAEQAGAATTADTAAAPRSAEHRRPVPAAGRDRRRAAARRWPAGGLEPAPPSELIRPALPRATRNGRHGSRRVRTRFRRSGRRDRGPGRRARRRPARRSAHWAGRGPRPGG